MSNAVETSYATTAARESEKCCTSESLYVAGVRPSYAVTQRDCEAARTTAYDETAGLSLLDLRARWHGHKHHTCRLEITDHESMVATAREEGVKQRMIETDALDLASVAAKLDVFFHSYREESQADLLLASIAADTKRLLPHVADA